MRSLDSAIKSWQDLKNYQTLTELKEATRLDGRTSAASGGLRSACWKAFVLLDTVETSQWPRTLQFSRSAYDCLRMHFLRRLENRDELEADMDPLSSETDKSPWHLLQKDEELRAEIQQDVDRCMSENLYFRQPDTKLMLLNILFVFARLNPDVAYRQGMHELLAPILWVVERDAIDLGQSSKAMGEDAVIKAVFDAEHIEHDAFALFSQVMHSAKNFYEQTTHSGSENPMVVRSKRIFSDLLPKLDPGLAQHLEDIDIVPQVFLMRWIRLLFGREFAFDDMLTVWDVIFAEDTSLEIVDHVCLAMLLRIHWELIEADYNGAIALLLRYPQPDRDFPAQTFALDALYLRDHMHTEGGSYVVLKYTGRPLQPIGRPLTPPALQRNITTFSGANALKAAASSHSKHLSPPQLPRQASNIEAMLQSTAKGLFARGEQLGIGKAVRSAVDEVHRKAQEIQAMQTPSPPAKRRGSLYSRVKELEERNRQLGRLLEGAISELWEYQKHAAEGTDSVPVIEGKGTGEGVEKLSVAIAKVQFVQVYLTDASLPLPEDDSARKDTVTRVQALETQQAPLSDQPPLPENETEAPASPVPQKLVSVERSKQVEELADPATFDEPSDEEPLLRGKDNPYRAVDNPQIPLNASADEDASTATTHPNPPGARPPLTQSQYLWMVGDDKEPAELRAGSVSGSVSGSPFPPEQKKNRGFLFGDGERSAEARSKRKGSGSRHKMKDSTSSRVEDVEEVFDLGLIGKREG